MKRVRLTKTMEVAIEAITRKVILDILFGYSPADVDKQIELLREVADEIEREAEECELT